MVTSVFPGAADFALYDNHVAALLDQAVYHIEHLRLGIADIPDAAVAATATG